MQNSFTSVFSAGGGGTDATKLPLTGGTLTGALTLPNSIFSGLSLTLAQATNTLDVSTTWNTTGNPTLIYGRASGKATSGASSNLLDLGTTEDGSRLSLDKNGQLTVPFRALLNNSFFVFDNKVNLDNAFNIVWTDGSYGGNPSLILSRPAAATLQLGANAASTATAQTIKAHNVTTGVGASLNLSGGAGSTATGSVILNSNAIFDSNCRLTFPNSSTGSVTSPGIGNWVGTLGIFGSGGALIATFGAGINFNATSTISFGSNAIIRGPSAATFYLGNEVASGWVSQTLAASGGRIGTDANNSPTNTFTIAGSVSTGTGTGGNLQLGVYGTNGASGTAIGTLNTVLTVVAARKVINISNIPTASTGVSGDVYSNAGVLMIVP
jgi:hypothetical protein